MNKKVKSESGVSLSGNECVLAGKLWMQVLIK